MEVLACNWGWSGFCPREVMLDKGDEPAKLGIDGIGLVEDFWCFRMPQQSSRSR